MASAAKKRPTETGTRAGTAKHRAGKATAQKILDAACDLLTERGHSNFSMRNVADAAGLHLANVQYYYPKRDNLVRAMLLNTGVRYQALYDAALRDAPTDPVERFKRVIQVNLDDIMSRETRQFFIQFWSLLDGMDGHSGRLLGELYAIDIGQLSGSIAAMHPATPRDEIERRATLLAAMIEGLMVVRGPDHRVTPKTRRLLNQAKKIAFAIANGAVED